jgi:aspartyl-tRNA(Asn)/glutamyl-tRNA(Gln) amidotransferase subunit C
MNVDKTLISKLENLARLELSALEKEEIQVDLEKILTMVDKLNELDTEGVQPLIHMSATKNQYRPDEIDPVLERKGSLENAPKRVDQYFAVPKVINKKN